MIKVLTAVLLLAFASHANATEKGELCAELATTAYQMQVLRNRAYVPFATKQSTYETIFNRLQKRFEDGEIDEELANTQLALARWQINQVFGHKPSADPGRVADSVENACLKTK